MARRNKKLPREAVEARIESLAQDGRGVAHLDGKAVFIDGALPGEHVLFTYTARRRKHDEGRVQTLLEASPERVAPRCAHFDICGGCSLQHLDAAAQVAAKERAMLDGLEHLAKVSPTQVLPPLTGETWGYRRKARLGVKYVEKKGRVLVGFREKRNSFLADIRRCEVLHPSVGEHIEDLAALIDTLAARERIAQIEVAVGEEAAVLVLRNLEALSEPDRKRLIDFAKARDLRLALQPGGADSVEPLWPESQALHYAHPFADVRIDFHPLDFFQVNREINLQMVPRALDLLEVGASDRVLDLFCGLGNFTLPLARRAREVVGVEGDAAMVARARENAFANGLHNTRYFVENLEQPAGQAPWRELQYDKILLDPPRSGAKEIMDIIGDLGARRIVYVSCHPGTLARDSAELVHRHGYTLEAAGVMDMFPHTAHVESIALFTR